MAKNKSTLFIADQRMLELMDYSIEQSLSQNKKDWCIQIGFNYTNLSQVTSGRQGFTDEQKLSAVKLAGADMNWLYGLSGTMLQDNRIVSPISLIEEGLRQLKRKERKAGSARSQSRSQIAGSRAITKRLKK